MIPTKFRWQPCLLIDRDEMSNLHRGHSIDASHQEDLKKSANQKQKLPVVAMFVYGLGQNEHSLQRTFHRSFLPSFSGFQRRRLKCEKLTDDGGQVKTNAHLAFGQASQKKRRRKNGQHLYKCSVLGKDKSCFENKITLILTKTSLKLTSSK